MILAVIPYALQCSHIRNLIPAALTHAFGFHSVSLWCWFVVCKTVKENCAQLSPSVICSLDYTIHQNKRTLYIYYPLQSIWREIWVEEPINQAFFSWKLLHQKSGSIAKFPLSKDASFPKWQGSQRGPETVHSCLHMSGRTSLCYVKHLQVHHNCIAFG